MMICVCGALAVRAGEAKPAEMPPRETLAAPQNVGIIMFVMTMLVLMIGIITGSAKARPNARENEAELNVSDESVTGKRWMRLKQGITM